MIYIETEYTSQNYARRALGVSKYELNQMLNDKEVYSLEIDDDRIINKDSLFHHDKVKERLLNELGIEPEDIRLIHGVKGFYGVTKSGEVINLTSMKYIQPIIDKGEYKCGGSHKYYQYINFYFHNFDGEIRCSHMSVHKLVAQEWLPNTKMKKFIHHIDTDRSNNHYMNLIWVSQSQHIDLHRLLKQKKFKDYWALIHKIDRENMC